MLILCPDCHRQYDVGGMHPGEQVRCRCGKLIKVPAEQRREAQMLHCSNCGGKLRIQAGRCDYCGSEITVAERNLGPACPACFARLPQGARFCSGCGIEIRPEAMKATRLSAQCPRCRGELIQRELHDCSYAECGGCAGIWLDEQSFNRVVEAKDASARGTMLPPSKEGSGAPPPDTVRYLPCPVCSQMMNRKNFAGCSGVIIDHCKGHGFWFDTHELEKIVSFVNAGGLDRSRKLEIDRQKAEVERVKQLHKRVTSGGVLMDLDRLPNRRFLEGIPDWLSILGDIRSFFR
jgi:Zn-finger nucleic acid-binding protein